MLNGLRVAIESYLTILCCPSLQKDYSQIKNIKAVCLFVYFFKTSYINQPDGQTSLFKVEGSTILQYYSIKDMFKKTNLRAYLKKSLILYKSKKINRLYYQQ